MRLSGDFDRHFLASIFQLLSDQGLSGILHLRSDRDHARVFMHDGEVINTPGGENRHRLGEWMIRAGMLDSVMLPSLIEDARAENCGLGTLLIGRGMLTPEGLRECLSKQTQELIWSTFNWQHGTFEFEPCDIDVSCKTIVRLNIQALILDALRRYDEASGCMSEADGDENAHIDLDRDFILDWDADEAPETQDIAGNGDPVRVLVVDDSKLLRHAVSAFLGNCPDITVIGQAANGEEAVRLNEQLDPDVITMDICMPTMDGLTALKHIMIRHPKPVIMLSTLSRNGAATTFEALRLGAVDFLSKPLRNTATSIEYQMAALEEKIRLAGRIDRASLALLRRPHPTPPSSTPELLAPGDRLVAGATAEGGYRAVLKILAGLQIAKPASVVVSTQSTSCQVDAFADYLARFSPLPVKRPKDGAKIQANACYLAAGTENVTVYRQNGHYCFGVSPVRITSGRQPIPLMTSVAESLGPHAAGLVLAGNAYEGTAGLQAIKAEGGTVIAQHPSGCQYHRVIAEAIECHMVDAVLTEPEIARWISSGEPA